MSLSTVALALTSAQLCLDADEIDMNGLAYFINEAHREFQVFQSMNSHSLHTAHMARIIQHNQEAAGMRP